MKRCLILCVFAFACKDAGYADAPPEGQAYHGQSKELVALIDSAHHVICYRRAYSEYMHALSCVPLDSAHWYPRVERVP